jgi:hypothetical protein
MIQWIGPNVPMSQSPSYLWMTLAA